MHPAYSVIFFTTASGAGYGLLFWLGLAEAAGALPGTRWFAPLVLTLALGLITVGLLSSTLHLGHPERAHRALSQWRSSWLSREGVVAVATYLPAGLWWLLAVLGIEPGGMTLLALLSAVGAALTVYCTAMIYASLRTIRQWHDPLVMPIYLTLSAATGALVLCLALAAHGGLPVWAGIACLVGLGAAAALKWSYWTRVDADPGQYTVQMALGHIGTARPLDPPHTQPNFVMREMGYSVARKHAEKLRMWVMLALFATPAVLTLVALLFPAAGGPLLLLAVAAAAAGVVTERWLFFAEAEHVSMLYYGKARA